MSLSIIYHPTGAIEFKASDICKSVGNFFNQLFLRKRTEKKNFLAKKEHLFNDITDDLLKNGEISYVDYYKSKNLLDIARKADEHYYKNSRESSSKEQPEIDFNANFEWWLRFYEASSLAFNEDIKDIWAIIMSKYISNPGSISINLLKTLSSLTANDVKLFKEVCSKSLVFSRNIVLLNDDDFLNKCKFIYSDLLYLNDLGLINSDGLLTIKNNIKAGGNWAFHNSSIGIVINNELDKDQEFLIPNFPFSRSGIELAKLFETTTTDDSIIYLGNYLKNQYTNLNVGCYHVIDIRSDGAASFDSSDIL